MKPYLTALTGITVLLAAHALGELSPLPGQEKSGGTRALEAGALALQSDAPADRLDIHLVGIHPLKDDPRHQMDAHHYCRQMNEDFAQCALFDGAGPEARLTGIEYIVSEKLFATLPAGERAYWHPHNYEILSGTLVAPGLPPVAETALMKRKLNSYGKTWHLWNTGHMNRPGDALPLGEPQLAWSLNRDGEADPQLLQGRDRRLDTDMAARRRDRTGLQAQARPQEGVDALKGRFGRPAQDLPGVSETQARPSP
ncbi:MAG: hypothetical protein K0R03_693 [Moraxellaceae bacterium]|jgi:hypothetical protein|nr:hypothetical protein [Moraxellaceae bacterium]